MPQMKPIMWSMHYVFIFFVFMSLTMMNFFNLSMVMTPKMESHKVLPFKMWSW